MGAAWQHGNVLRWECWESGGWGPDARHEYQTKRGDASKAQGRRRRAAAEGGSGAAAFRGAPCRRRRRRPIGRLCCCCCCCYAGLSTLHLAWRVACYGGWGWRAGGCQAWRPACSARLPCQAPREGSIMNQHKLYVRRLELGGQLPGSCSVAVRRSAHGIRGLLQVDDGGLAFAHKGQGVGHTLAANARVAEALHFGWTQQARPSAIERRRQRRQAAAAGCPQQRRRQWWQEAVVAAATGSCSSGSGGAGDSRRRSSRLSAFAVAAAAAAIAAAAAAAARPASYKPGKGSDRDLVLARS